MLRTGSVVAGRDAMFERLPYPILPWFDFG
jgi:hypothetical protein